MIAVPPTTCCTYITYIPGCGIIASYLGGVASSLKILLFYYCQQGSVQSARMSKSLFASRLQVQQTLRPNIPHRVGTKPVLYVRFPLPLSPFVGVDQTFVDVTSLPWKTHSSRVSAICRNTALSTCYRSALLSLLMYRVLLCYRVGNAFDTPGDQTPKPPTSTSVQTITMQVLARADRSDRKPYQPWGGHRAGGRDGLGGDDPARDPGGAGQVQGFPESRQLLRGHSGA